MSKLEHLRAYTGSSAINPFEGLQQATTGLGNLMDKYQEREDKKEQWEAEQALRVKEADARLANMDLQRQTYQGQLADAQHVRDQRDVLNRVGAGVNDSQANWLAYSSPEQLAASNKVIATKVADQTQSVLDNNPTLKQQYDDVNARRALLDASESKLKTPEELATFKLKNKDAYDKVNADETAVMGTIRGTLEKHNLGDRLTADGNQLFSPVITREEAEKANRAYLLNRGVDFDNADKYSKGSADNLRTFEQYQNTELKKYEDFKDYQGKIFDFTTKALKADGQGSDDESKKSSYTIDANGDKVYNSKDKGYLGAEYVDTISKTLEITDPNEKAKIMGLLDKMREMRISGSEQKSILSGILSSEGVYNRSWYDNRWPSLGLSSPSIKEDVANKVLEKLALDREQRRTNLGLPINEESAQAVRNEADKLMALEALDDYKRAMATPAPYMQDMSGVRKSQFDTVARSILNGDNLSTLGKKEVLPQRSGTTRNNGTPESVASTQTPNNPTVSTGGNTLQTNRADVLPPAPTAPTSAEIASSRAAVLSNAGNLAVNPTDDNGYSTSRYAVLLRKEKGDEFANTEGKKLYDSLLLQASKIPEGPARNQFIDSVGLLPNTTMDQIDAVNSYNTKMLATDPVGKLDRTGVLTVPYKDMKGARDFDAKFEGKLKDASDKELSAALDYSQALRGFDRENGEYVLSGKVNEKGELTPKDELIAKTLKNYATAAGVTEDEAKRVLTSKNNHQALLNLEGRELGWNHGRTAIEAALAVPSAVTKSVWSLGSMGAGALAGAVEGGKLGSVDSSERGAILGALHGAFAAPLAKEAFKFGKDVITYSKAKKAEKEFDSIAVDEPRLTVPLSNADKYKAKQDVIKDTQERVGAISNTIKKTEDELTALRSSYRNIEKTNSDISKVDKSVLKPEQLDKLRKQEELLKDITSREELLKRAKANREMYKDRLPQIEKERDLQTNKSEIDKWHESRIQYIKDYLLNR